MAVQLSHPSRSFTKVWPRPIYQVRHVPFTKVWPRPIYQVRHVPFERGIILPWWPLASAAPVAFEALEQRTFHPLAFVPPRWAGG